MRLARLPDPTQTAGRIPWRAQYARDRRPAPAAHRPPYSSRLSPSAVFEDRGRSAHSYTGRQRIPGMPGRRFCFEQRRTQQRWRRESLWRALALEIIKSRATPYRSAKRRSAKLWPLARNGKLGPERHLRVHSAPGKFIIPARMRHRGCARRGFRKLAAARNTATGSLCAIEPAYASTALSVSPNGSRPKNPPPKPIFESVA